MSAAGAASGERSALYEITVGGALGPVLRAAVAGFDTTTVSRRTVLTGRATQQQQIFDLWAGLDRHHLVVDRVQIVSIAPD